MRLVGLIAAFAFATFSSSSSNVAPDATRTPERPGDTISTPVGRAVTRDAGAIDRVRQAYTQLPLSFEANQGQTHSRVDFLSRGTGYTLFLSPTEAVVSVSPTQPAASTPGRAQTRQSAVVRMKLVGANEQAEAVAADRLAGTVNYFIGNDPGQWRTGVPTYAKATYRGVYRGIDIVYYGNQQRLEYDFVVQPGSSVETIGLRFEGVEHIELDQDGELRLNVEGGVIRQGKPYIYQIVDGQRHTIAGGYVLDESSQVGFDVGPYDTSLPLVIDPTLVYSTYLGSSLPDQSDEMRAIAVDTEGAAYVAGIVYRDGFPTTPGAYDSTFNGTSDIVVTKFDPTGSTLVYSTYLGGTGGEAPDGIAVDASGNVYVTGGVRSVDFPTTAGAFDITPNSAYDAYVTKLNATGSALVYSTYLGGRFDEGTFGALRIAVDGSGSAHVTGETGSDDIPTTPGAFDRTPNGDYDMFVIKFTPNGSALMYSTYLGGVGIEVPNGIAIDASGNAYVTGITGSANYPTTSGAYDMTLDGSRDAMVTKLNATGSALVYSTFVGGTLVDQAEGIAIDAAGNAYVAGQTNSTDFPTTAGALDATYNGGLHDAFAAKVSATGSALDYSTYLGGAIDETARGIAVDGAGNAYVLGETTSTDFPMARPIQGSFNGGLFDLFVTKLTTGGSLSYSTYLGGANSDRASAVAVDNLHNVYVTGYTHSSNFPTTVGAYDMTYNGSSDGFVAKIADVLPAVTVTLGPGAATNRVDSKQCVTATAQDQAGGRVPGVTVRFDVTGAVIATGLATTDARGQAEFCYPGALRPGPVAVRAQQAR